MVLKPSHNLNYFSAVADFRRRTLTSIDLLVIGSEEPHCDTHSSYGLLAVHGAPRRPGPPLNQVPGGQVLNVPSIAVDPSTLQHS